MSRATSAEGFDLVVLVKRWTQAQLDGLRGVPIVWDVLDAWPQPRGNEWDREACMQWLRAQVEQIRPCAIVAATQAMARDCIEFGVPVLALPHHARPGQALNPVRVRVATVGYEGGDYLGKWRKVLERECGERGWQFVVNPACLAHLDIVVALREANGYAARNWKSNCKLANAQDSGTPCVLSLEAGYRETMSGAEYWAETTQELHRAFGELTPHETRLKAARSLLKAAPTLEVIAGRYKAWLSALR